MSAQRSAQASSHFLLATTQQRSQNQLSGCAPVALLTRVLLKAVFKGGNKDGKCSLFAMLTLLWRYEDIIIREQLNEDRF